MSGIYIPGMEMPTNCCQCPVNMEVCKRGYKYLLEHPELYDKRADDCPLVPVPEHKQILRVLKTEKECVSRDCDRDCGKCDLSLEREKIAGVYDVLIAMFDPADLEVDESGVYAFWAAFNPEPISAEFIVEQIGQTVFLSKEEAERSER